jgi:hypothetical protein
MNEFRFNSANGRLFRAVRYQGELFLQEILWETPIDGETVTGLEQSTDWCLAGKWFLGEQLEILNREVGFKAPIVDELRG